MARHTAADSLLEMQEKKGGRGDNGASRAEARTGQIYDKMRRSNQVDLILMDQPAQQCAYLHSHVIQQAIVYDKCWKICGRLRTTYVSIM